MDVVLIVRQALQLVIPTLTTRLNSTANTNKSLFIFLVVLVNKIRDLLLAKRCYKHTSFAVFGLCTGMYADAGTTGYVSQEWQYFAEFW